MLLFFSSQLYRHMNMQTHLSYRHCHAEGLFLWCLPSSPECSGNTHSSRCIQICITCLQTRAHANTFSLADTVILRHCGRIMTSTMSALYQFSIGTFGIFSRTWLLWQCSACVSCWRHTHTSTTAVTSSRSLCPSWPTDIQRLVLVHSVCVLCVCDVPVYVCPACACPVCLCVCVNIQRSLMVFCTTMVVCVCCVCLCMSNVCLCECV